MIRFEQVTKRYLGGYEILRDVNLDIERGEMVFLTGHSGAGKTTLLKLVAAIERPTGGSVWVNEQNISRIKHSALPYLRRNIGLVFQDHKLLFDRNVIHNVLLPLDIAGFSRHDAFSRARAALDKVGLLPREKSLPITLSGGEQQRLCIARAIVTRPPLLLADEPTGNLDHAYASDIMSMMLGFHQSGTTIVISSHDPAAAVSAGRHRIIHLDHGSITS